MLYEIYFIKYYYLLLKENNFSLMSQFRQAPTTEVHSYQQHSKNFLNHLSRNTEVHFYQQHSKNFLNHLSRNTEVHPYQQHSTNFLNHLSWNFYKHLFNSSSTLYITPPPGQPNLTSTSQHPHRSSFLLPPVECEVHRGEISKRSDPRCNPDF